MALFIYYTIHYHQFKDNIASKRIDFLKSYISLARKNRSSLLSCWITKRHSFVEATICLYNDYTKANFVSWRMKLNMKKIGNDKILYIVFFHRSKIDSTDSIFILYINQTAYNLQYINDINFTMYNYSYLSPIINLNSANIYLVEWILSYSVRNKLFSYFIFSNNSKFRLQFEHWR